MNRKQLSFKPHFLSAFKVNKKVNVLITSHMVVCDMSFSPFWMVVRLCVH